MIDSKTLEKAMEAASPIVELKLPLENLQERFDVCIDGRTTNHHYLEDVPKEVFHDEWQASMTQTITPQTQTDYVEWLIDMGPENETAENMALLSNWLAWTSGHLCKHPHEAPKETVDEARRLCGGTWFERPLSDTYEKKLEFAQTLLDIDSRQRQNLGDDESFIERYFQEDREANFYHGLTFSQGYPGGEIRIMASWATHNQDMDTTEEIGRMDEESFRDTAKLSSFLRDNYHSNLAREERAPRM